MTKDKIELNLISKIIKKEIRAYNQIKTNEITIETLENTKSTKKIKKELSSRKKWTTYLVDDEGKKIYNG